MLNILGGSLSQRQEGIYRCYLDKMNAVSFGLFRWNGVVGHTLYGDVDVGMCNIDITHSRYSGAVDYSAFIRYQVIIILGKSLGY